MCVYTYIYIYIYVYVYTCVYIFICVCVYIYIYIYTHTCWYIRSQRKHACCMQVRCRRACAHTHTHLPLSEVSFSVCTRKQAHRYIYSSNMHIHTCTRGMAWRGMARRGMALHGMAQQTEPNHGITYTSTPQHSLAYRTQSLRGGATCTIQSTQGVHVHCIQSAHRTWSQYARVTHTWAIDMVAI